jgi:hypothetical protein
MLLALSLIAIIALFISNAVLIIKHDTTMLESIGYAVILIVFTLGVCTTLCYLAAVDMLRDVVLEVENNKALIQCADDTRIWIDLPECTKLPKNNEEQ